MYCKTIVSFLMLISLSCKSSNSREQGNSNEVKKVYKTDSLPGENPYAAVALIPPPGGFKRYNEAEHSFSQWLGQIHLKKSKMVYLFDGSKKENQEAQFAVLDIPVGNKNLQQCADAVMRLRATYLFDRKQYDSIVFYDNEGKSYHFSAPYSPGNFNNYLQIVFGMCGTASLSKQLKKINEKDIQPGDVLIRGGFPGHAVIVMDVVVNKDGQKKYMIAQSYMPAQDIHILLNPEATGLSPWYDLTDADVIRTPEYTFNSNEFKRW